MGVAFKHLLLQALSYAGAATRGRGALGSMLSRAVYDLPWCDAMREETGICKNKFIIKADRDQDRSWVVNQFPCEARGFVSARIMAANAMPCCINFTF